MHGHGRRRICESLALGSAILGCAVPVAAQAQDAAPVVVLSEMLAGDVDGQSLFANGNVEIISENFTLQADQAHYEAATRVISAFGNVRLRGLGAALIEADKVAATSDLSRIFARNVSLSFGQGRLLARRAVVTSQGKILLERVSVTGCPDCGDDRWPLWSVNARRAERDAETDRIIFDTAILRVKGVPIAYVPAISFPSPEVPRATGFLLPTLGNSRVGPTVELPYHWVMTPNQDVTVSARLTGQAGPIAQIAYRADVNKMRLGLSGALTHDPQQNDSAPDDGSSINVPLAAHPNWRGHVNGSAGIDLTREWRLGAIVERQSDAGYDLRYAVARAQRGTDRLYWGAPRSLLSQAYLTGSGQDYDIELSALSFQDISAEPVAPAEPTLIPMARVRRKITDKRLGVADLDLFATAAQSGTSGIDALGWAQIAWQKRLRVGPGMILAPHALARFEGSRNDAIQTTNTSARAGVELSWPLAVVGRRGIVIEPRAWVSTRLDSGNSPTPRPFWANVAQTVGFSNPVHAGSQNPPIAFAGLDSKASVKGLQLGLSAGRRWFSDAQQDTVVAIRLSQDAQFAAVRLVMDDGLAVRESDMTLAFSTGRLTGRLTYFVSRSSGREGGRLALSYQLDDRWSFTYTQESNIIESFNILQSAEVAYDGACTSFSISLRRSEISFGAIRPETTIGLRLAFKIPS